VISRRLAAFLLGALWLSAGTASADIAFPARLDVTEREPGVYDISFTLPIVEGRKLRAEPRMPPTCVESSPRETGVSSGGFTSTWSVRCEPASLAGEAILVEGLLGTQTDLAFTLTTLDGRSYSRILRPSRPGFLVPDEPSTLALAVEAAFSGVQRAVRHLSLWLVLAVAALLGQRPRTLVTAAGTFALGHFLAQWLGGQGWLEVAPPLRDLLVWTTIVVPALRLAGGGEGWRDWLQPLWPAALLLGLLFGGAQPEALPPEGLSRQPSSCELSLSWRPRVVGWRRAIASLAMWSVRSPSGWCWRSSLESRSPLVAVPGPHLSSHCSRSSWDRPPCWPDEKTSGCLSHSWLWPPSA